DHISSSAPIEQNGHIELAGFTIPRIIYIFRYEYLMNFFTFRRSLWGYQVHPDNITCDLLYLPQVFGQFYTAALPTSPSMDLSFYYMPARTGLLCQLLGRIYGFLGIIRNQPTLDTYAKT